MTENLLAYYRIFCIIVFTYCAYEDVRTNRIPNAITYPLLVVTLFVTLVTNQWPHALYGGLLASCILCAPRFTFRHHSIGMGDVKLGILGGLVVGIKYTLFSLVIAYVTAFIILIPFVITKRLNWQQPIPFGPFIAIGFSVFILLQVTQ